jgi:hypothetical protein
MDKDESTRKLEREAEAAAKRQQNALPAWHLKSTISGDLTALGIQEHARAETSAAAAAAAAISGVSSTNDDILKGLGVVGGSRMERAMPAPIIEDVKPIINREADCEFSPSTHPVFLTFFRLRPILRFPGGIDSTIRTGNAVRIGCSWQRRFWRFRRRG